ncbi:MAG: proline dehydrogenase family protein, partial [Chloroflexota bacterium]
MAESIRELEKRLRASAASRPPLALTPAWFQQRLFDWASSDPDFRVKLLRFVDVLPALRSTRAVSDHVRQYFRGAHQPLIGATTSIAAAPVFRPILSRVVREGVFAMASRFIAGATPEEAISALRDLAAHGVSYTVDLLGEETLSDAEADAYLERYVQLVTTLADHAEELTPHGDTWANVPPVNISIKLSALCPHLEPAAPRWVSQASVERLRTIMRAAMRHGAFVNFDMEQYRNRELVETAFTDILLEPEFAAYPNAGIVVQAYLRNAEEQIARLREFAERRGAPISVRLVKGAYWDEERIVAEQNGWPLPVYAIKRDTDDSYDRCTDALLAAWPHLRPVFGTHNPWSVAQAVVKSRAASIPDAEIEFQMLYGMAEGLRGAIAEMGLRTRVYVPIGQMIPGMAYLVRRLLENTSNQAWFNAGASGIEKDGRDSSSAALFERPGPQSSIGHDAAFDHDPLSAIQNSPPAAFFLSDTRARMYEALEARRGQFGAHYPLLIGDKQVSDRAETRVEYPAEPKTTAVGLVAQATRDDVHAAVTAARSAYPAWRD